MAMNTMDAMDAIELLLSMILCMTVDLPFLLIHVPTMAIVILLYVFVGALVIVRMLILPLVAVLFTVIIMEFWKSSMVAFVWITGLHLYGMMKFLHEPTTEKEKRRPILFLDAYLE